MPPGFVTGPYAEGITTWMSYRHLKLNVFETTPILSPISCSLHSHPPWDRLSFILHLQEVFPIHLEVSYFLQNVSMGTWMAQSVDRRTSVQGRALTFHELEVGIGCAAVTTGPALGPPSPHPAPAPLPFVRALSLKNK